MQMPDSRKGDDVEIAPEAVAWNSLYKLMIGAIVPRPIAWVSTVNDAGMNNLAPFSFFNAVCANPPTLLFTASVRGADGGEKDTLRNIRANGEFVVNVVTETLAEAMNLTSTEFPAVVDEFAAAGLTPLPCARVRPARVGESPVSFECLLDQVIDVGDQPGGGSIVIGRIVYLHVIADVLIDSDKIDITRLQPIGRLAGNAYCRVNDLFDMARPASQITPR